MPSWNELFKDEKYIWKEPHEGVVELAGLLRESANRRVLDLGCGAGRHLVYLARQGFEVYGTDISEVGLEHARGWLLSEGLSAETRLADMTAIPYPDAYFAGILSVYVIFHNTLAGMRQSIQEIVRTLVPGGWAFLTFQSKRSYRYGRGRELDPETFIADLGGDAGMPHHYSDLCELERELDGLVLRKILLDEHQSSSGEGGLSSHWHIWAQKPDQAGVR